MQAAQWSSQGEGGSGGLKGQETLNELATEFGVHPVQIAHCKRQALDRLPTLFEGAASRREQAGEAPSRRSPKRLASTRWRGTGCEKGAGFLQE